MDNKRQIILLGKTGNGKSATGNSILQRKHFEAGMSPSAVTTSCRRKCAFRCDVGRTYEVVDTPGLFDTEVPLAKTAREVQKALKYCLNPHAFLLVLSSVDRFANDEIQTIRLLDIMFGDSFMEHAIIVFTRGGEFDRDGQCFEDFLTRSESLKKVIDMCGNRVLRIENQHAGSENLMYGLLNSIETLSENGKKRFMPDASELKSRKDELQKHIKEDLKFKDPLEELEHLKNRMFDRIEKDKKFNEKLKLVCAGLATGAAAVGFGVLRFVNHP